MISPPGGLEPPTFRLTAERASQLRHGGFVITTKLYYLYQKIVIIQTFLGKRIICISNQDELILLG